MPADKPRPTLADYVTIAISPALIMAMIVSLVFFVLAVLYRGDFVNRLHIILFFFIFGIVLVARVAMAGYAERAPIYGGVLSVLVWLGMGNFVNYPPELVATGFINAGLILLAWWLSHQLTHSCTYIDEKAESTGTGVLEGAGLEKSAAPVTAQSEDLQPPQPAGKRNKTREPSWWERYQSFREKRRKTQPPGVWVVYFALAALPIFGLGQALIDVADHPRRAYTFQLMALYLASSLGLLVTTAFLGLRRYLRQRRLEMPKMVTAAWLVVGGVLLASLVVIGAVLPRPQAEFSLLDLGRADSKKLAASKYAVSRGEPGKGKGRPGAQEHDPDGDPASSNDSDRKGSGGKGKNKGNDGKGKDGKGSAKGSKSKGKQESETRDQDKKSSDSRDPQNKEDGDQSGDSKAEEPDQQATPPDDSGSGSFLKNLIADVSKLLKWIVFGILIVVTLLFVLGGGLRYLANFTDWARRLLDALRRFWEGLFGLPQRGTATLDDDAARRAPRPSFQFFANPFHNGGAGQMSPAELIRYSFEALEAWAAESDCERVAQETPLEFTNRLADEVGSLDKETRRLGTLYACVLYARGNLPADWRATLEEFWTRLEALPAGRFASQEV
jgi:hypothetical protein